jgi:hypothetical protein
LLLLLYRRHTEPNYESSDDSDADSDNENSRFAMKKNNETSTGVTKEETTPKSDDNKDSGDNENLSKYFKRLFNRSRNKEGSDDDDTVPKMSMYEYNKLMNP